LTQYAIEKPESWTVTNGCQNGRGSSIHSASAMPVLSAAIRKKDRGDARKPAASRSAKLRRGEAAVSASRG
jgi:hypothetical protein